MSDRFLPIPMKLLSAGLVASILVQSATIAAVDLSPEKWGADERARVEKLAQLPMPPEPRAIDAKSGIVSATMSPIAVRAGVEKRAQARQAMVVVFQQGVTFGDTKQRLRVQLGGDVARAFIGG